jgi:uncharacterized protein (TIRG00374 family)
VNKRQIVFLVAKIAFAGAVLTWLLHRVDAYRVFASIREAHRIPILFAITVCLITMVIGSWRWQRLLAMFGISIPLRSLICTVQVGQFFAIFLPGPTGDDLTRMLYISRLAPGRVGEACTSVVLDRCIGMTSLLILAVFGIPSQWSVLSTSSQTYCIAVAILLAGTLVCIGVAVFFMTGHPTHRWFERRLRSLPAHSLRDEAARIWGLLCDNKILVAEVIGAAVITQILNCVIFYLAGVSVGIHCPLLLWMTFVPIVLAANAIPVTIAGIGIREYLLVLFLGVIAGVDNAGAFAASFVVFSVLFTMCLLGGLLYIFYKPKRALSAIDESSTSAR